MANQQPPQHPPHAAHADEDEQKQTDVDRQADVDHLFPPVVGDAPRHCHAQRPAMRPRREESLAADSQPSSPPELYRDALYAIYGWLTFNELVPTSRINKSWYTAACNLKSRGERLKKFSDRVISQMVHSPLRRHITQLTSGTVVCTHLTVASLALLKTLP
jgi:hypothetical protein